MTTCLDCEFSHVLNVFIVDWEGPDGWTPVLECPSCGSGNCVKNSVAKEKLDDHNPDPLGDAIELIAGE